VAAYAIYSFFKLLDGFLVHRGVVCYRFCCCSLAGCAKRAVHSSQIPTKLLARKGEMVKHMVPFCLLPKWDIARFAVVLRGVLCGPVCGC
jgi:hypothetical protein